MYRIIECLTHEHNYGLLAVATVVCVMGSCLTALIARKSVVSHRQRKQAQTFLAALIGGATIWSTHFLSMLAYEPGLPHGYDPVLTAVSLLVAGGGLLIAKGVLGFARSPSRFILGGAIFGLTVASMHYLGMSAYKLPGQVTWDPLVVLASIALGSLFGIAAYHRIMYPQTKYCWLGGAAFLVLSICSMHFTGMTAFTLELNPLVEVPEAALSDMTLGIVICSVTCVLFILGYVGVSLEDRADSDARIKIEATATIDALTLLPNRLGLTKELSACKAQLEKDENLRVAILTIDLDRFKEVNDLYGHADGDIVLSQITRRFSTALTEGEFVARSGGDEFVAIKKGYRRKEEVKAFAERLNGAFTETIHMSSATLFISGSIGVATTVDDGPDLDSLLQKSDVAMYRAKTDPDKHIVFFDVEMG